MLGLHLNEVSISVHPVHVPKFEVTRFFDNNLDFKFKTINMDFHHEDGRVIFVEVDKDCNFKFRTSEDSELKKVSINELTKKLINNNFKLKKVRMNRWIGLVYKGKRDYLEYMVSEHETGEPVLRELYTFFGAASVHQFK